jgi:hypothetical protein
MLEPVGLRRAPVLTRAVAPRLARPASSALGRHAPLGEPQPVGGLAGLTEEVIGIPPRELPVAADARPYRLDGCFEASCDGQRTILMEGTVIAKRVRAVIRASPPLAARLLDAP